MNPDTNTFHMMGDEFKPPSEWIPFNVGEEIEIKGHVFSVVAIDIPKNPAKEHLLILAPKRKP